VIYNLSRCVGWITITECIYFRWLVKDTWLEVGRAIAQAVSSRLPTEKAQVRARVRSCEIWGGQSGTGAGFFRVLSSIIIWGWYNRPVIASEIVDSVPLPSPKRRKKEGLWWGNTPLQSSRQHIIPTLCITILFQADKQYQQASSLKYQNIITSPHLKLYLIATIPIVVCSFHLSRHNFSLAQS
jgi:hypothetical protein